MPANLAALLERFPKQSSSQLAAHLAVLVAVSALGLWGILAAEWSVGAVLAFLGIEIATIWLLNWLAIALLPMHLESNDRSAIKGWLWFGGVLLIGLLAYVAIEGEAGASVLRDSLQHRLGKAYAYLATRNMLWPAAGLVLTHLAGLLTDIGYWRKRGGAFRYWSASVFVMRLMFVMAVGGLLFAFGAITGVLGGGRGTVVLVWALLVAADLFAFWMPIALRRKAERDP
ncbi:MAG: hypothetical protein ABIP49_10815 [Lysobacterales bacterium]